MQECIEELENGKDNILKDLLEMIKSPFEMNGKLNKYMRKRPEKYNDIPGFSKLSCSS